MSDIAFRYLRLRPGTNQPGENTSSHGMIIGTGEDIILDHVSFSWANDQLLSIYNYPNGGGRLDESQYSVRYSASRWRQALSAMRPRVT